MPSPFPGMDPYLENPEIWPDVHLKLISTISEKLAPQIGAGYVVRAELRIYVSDENDPGRKVMVPDVRILTGSTSETKRRPVRSNAGGSGVDVAEPVEATILFDNQIEEARLLIKNIKSRQVVTVIEVLSPANKVPSARGRENYVQKREQVLGSGTNLVEIDLLRAGHRFGPAEPLPPHQYLALVSRAGKRPRATLWPIRLDQRLPEIPIPLLPRDPDAKLDLQDVFTTVYDRSYYIDDIDFRKEPVPRLPPKWRAWADELLKSKKMRK